MAITAKGPMDIPAPAKQDEAPEWLSDVIDDARADTKQRWIGWLCGLLTIATLVAAWQLL